MHVQVIGAGAVGTFLAAQFARTTDVTLIDRHIRGACSRDITVLGQCETTQTVRVAQEVVPADLVVVATRVGQLRDLLTRLGGYHVPVLLCQNGLGINEIALSSIPVAPVGRLFLWGGFSRETIDVAHCKGIARVAGASLRDFDFTHVAALLRCAGIALDHVDDPNRCEWEKAMWNVGVNALCAISDAERNGVVLESEPLLTALRHMLAEAQTIAALEGYELHSVDSVIAHTQTTRNNENSMRRDLRLGRITEIEALNGYIVRAGRLHGVPTPYNELAYLLVKHLECTRSRPPIEDMK